MFSLLAANNFSLTPPIFKTYPYKVISPVIPTSKSVYLFVAREINEVVIAIPADGPSFLEAPDGKCI